MNTKTTFLILLAAATGATGGCASTAPELPDGARLLYYGEVGGAASVKPQGPGSLYATRGTPGRVVGMTRVGDSKWVLSGLKFDRKYGFYFVPEADVTTRAADGFQWPPPGAEVVASGTAPIAFDAQVAAGALWIADLSDDALIYASSDPLGRGLYLVDTQSKSVLFRPVGMTLDNAVPLVRDFPPDHKYAIAYKPSKEQ